MSAPPGLPTLHFMTCGSVDDGKSTLIGRLLTAVGVVPDDQLHRRPALEVREPDPENESAEG